MSTHELRDHVALITGAGRGIGRAIAIELARRGADLGLLARNERELAQTAATCREHGAKSVTIAADITDASAVDRGLARLRAELHAPEIVVINHGIYRQGSSLDTDPASWDRVLDVNLRSAMQLTRETLPGMLEAAGEQQHRALVYVSSIAARHHYAGAAAYCASKAGLSAFADVVFEEVRDRGVKVVQILPGFVNTAMMAGAADTVDTAKMVQPEDVASAVGWAVLSPRSCCPVEIVLRPQYTPYRR